MEALVGIRLQRPFTRGERPPVGTSSRSVALASQRIVGAAHSANPWPRHLGADPSDSRPPKRQPSHCFHAFNPGARLSVVEPILGQPGSTRGVGFELTMPRCVSGRAGTRQRSSLRWRQVGPPAGNLVGIAGKVPASRIWQVAGLRNSESRQHSTEVGGFESKAPYLGLSIYYNVGCFFFPPCGSQRRRSVRLLPDQRVKDSQGMTELKGLLAPLP
jgi:hypothetical protein